MDNATKAILISGGILLALLVLSVMVAMFNNIQQMEEAKDRKEVIAEINEWNAEWEAYNKKVMYGSDILTVVNTGYVDSMTFKFIRK